MKKNLENPIGIPGFKVNEITDIVALSQTAGWNVKNLKIPDLWKDTQGEGIHVVVLDTGFFNHVDLRENIKRGPSFVPGQWNNDKNGHGTHVAGTIAAVNNQSGMVGIAPKAKVTAVKVLANNGSSSELSLLKGLRWVVAQDNVDVVNVSLGSPNELSQLIRNEIKKLYDKNIPVVCASGNDGVNRVYFPASFEETIAVGAINSRNQVAGFSNTGKNLDFVAPGVNIFSTWIGNKYATASGSSMASPWVTGIICLMLSKHRKGEKEGKPNDCVTLPQIKEHLIKICNDMGPKGKDDKWGYGIIQPHRIISEASTIITLPQPPKEKEPEKGFLQRLSDKLFGRN